MGNETEMQNKHHILQRGTEIQLLSTEDQKYTTVCGEQCRHNLKNLPKICVSFASLSLPLVENEALLCLKQAIVHGIHSLSSVINGVAFSYQRCSINSVPKKSSGAEELKQSLHILTHTFLFSLLSYPSRTIHTDTKVWSALYVHVDNRF